MAKNGTEFSKYAQVFHKIIDGKKTNIDIFTKDLLKMGLTDNDKAYIDGEFPTFKDDKGVRHITDNKGDKRSENVRCISEVYFLHFSYIYKRSYAESSTVTQTKILEKSKKIRSLIK